MGEKKRKERKGIKKKAQEGKESQLPRGVGVLEKEDIFVWWKDREEPHKVLDSKEEKGREGKESPKTTVKRNGFERSLTAPLSHWFLRSRNRRKDLWIFSGGNRNPILLNFLCVLCVFVLVSCLDSENTGWKTLAIFSAVRFEEGGATSGSTGLEKDEDCGVGTGRRFEASHWGFRV